MKKTKQIHPKKTKGQPRPTPSQIADFLEDFRQVVAGQSSSTKLISLRVPENLLQVFKAEAERSGMKYQSQIVRLMRDWVLKK